MYERGQFLLLLVKSVNTQKCSKHGFECANWLSSLLNIQFSGKWLNPSSPCDYSN